MTDTVSEGDTIRFKPNGGGSFPTGERTRTAEVEAVRGEEIIVRQDDGYTDRITEDQIV